MRHLEEPPALALLCLFLGGFAMVALGGDLFFKGFLLLCGAIFIFFFCFVVEPGYRKVKKILEEKK